MKIFRSGLLFSLAVIMVMATQASYGQQAPFGGRSDEMLLAENEPGPNERGAMSEEKREEIRKKIETIRIWRLTEALKLDPQTSAKLASLVSSFDQQRRDIQREQMETMRSLRRTLKSPKPDETKLKASLETLERNHQAMQDLRSKEFGSLKSILTLEQEARYLLFQHEFQREMRNMIAGARGGGEGKGGGRQGGRPRMREGRNPPEEPE